MSLRRCVTVSLSAAIRGQPGIIITTVDDQDVIVDETRVHHLELPGGARVCQSDDPHPILGTGNVRVWIECDATVDPE